MNILLTVIGTKAYTLLRNIVVPEKLAAKEYDQLVEAFGAHLDPKPIIIAEWLSLTAGINTRADR